MGNLQNLRDLIGICEAVEIVTSRRLNLSTGWRWATRGCSGVRLQTAVFGGKMLTKTEWVEDFVAAVTAARHAKFISPVAAPSKSRDKQIAKASADLHAKLNKPKRAKAKA